MPPVGLQKSQLDTIQKKLVELSNLINPAYFGVSDITEIQDKNIFVLYCPGGDHSPYDAPISLSKKNRGRAHWVRRYNSTVRANQNELQTLHELAARVPFDDRVNHRASLRALSLALIKEFLQNVKSPLFEQSDSISFEELCLQMQIIKKLDETLRPINAGLLLFNEKPEEFFPSTQIDVVIYRDEVGDRFSEKIFKGPIHKQLRNALDYIQNNVIREEVRKVAGQAEANRFYNYPYAAIEEVLANAVYHKSYERRSPIEVNIRLDQIEVLSFPGPLPPVDNKMLQKKRIVAREYRNRRIGDFLKELQLTEGRATGFPKIYDAMKRNGSSEPMFETDNERSYFLAVLPVHPDMEKKGQAGGHAKGQAGGHAMKISLNDTEKAILEILKEGPCSTSELLEKLGLESRTGAFRRNIKNLMKKGLIEYVYPNNPKHPDQKYRLST